MGRPSDLGWRRLATRVAIVWVIESAALLLLAAVLPGVDLRGVEASIAAVAVVGLVNALLWPLLVRLALRLLVLTLGFAALLLNAGVILLADAILPGFDVSNFGNALLLAVGLSALNAAASGLLAIDDDDSYYRGVVLHGARRREAARQTDEPGVFMLEIDGLSEPTLRRAIADGHMPTLSRWLEEGSHRVVHWECDLSSQTAASQAGLLMGDNTDIPAFRWYDRQSETIVVASSRGDCAEMERRLSSGDGLLAGGGVSIGNLLTGDAARSLFTFSTAAVGNRPPRDFLAFFANPYAMTRTLALMMRDVIIERRAAWGQRLRKEQPSIRRGLKYSLIRAATVVALRDLSVATLMGNLFAGTPTAYATFFGYDEVAHHSGIERRDAMAVLHEIDAQFGRLERAAQLAPRPYHFVVLSDHGQSQGATFLQRYGKTLEDVVRGALSEPRTVGALEASEEGRAGVGAALADVAQTGGVMARVARRAEPPEEDEEAGIGAAGAIVLASGNLGLIYLPGGSERLTLEEIQQLHPRLLPALVEHPGIAFARVRSKVHGTMVLGAGGTRRLVDGHVEHSDPLAAFGPRAAAHLLRHDGFAHTPDVLVNSSYDPDTGEVAAFEELVGSHGGLGGPQAHPFALVPSGWSPVDEPVVGAAAMHTALKGWIESLSVTAR